MAKVIIKFYFKMIEQCKNNSIKYATRNTGPNRWA